VEGAGANMSGVPLCRRGAPECDCAFSGYWSPHPARCARHPPHQGEGEGASRMCGGLERAMGPRFRGGDMWWMRRERGTGVRLQVQRVLLTPPGALRAPPSPSRGGRGGITHVRRFGESDGPPLSRGGDGVDVGRGGDMGGAGVTCGEWGDMWWMWRERG